MMVNKVYGNQMKMILVTHEDIRRIIRALDLRTALLDEKKESILFKNLKERLEKELIEKDENE